MLMQPEVKLNTLFNTKHNRWLAGHATMLAMSEYIDSSRYHSSGETAKTVDIGYTLTREVSNIWLINRYLDSFYIIPDMDHINMQSTVYEAPDPISLAEDLHKGPRTIIAKGEVLLPHDHRFPANLDLDVREIVIELLNRMKSCHYNIYEIVTDRAVFRLVGSDKSRFLLQTVISMKDELSAENGKY
jgi:hypothetical protein